MNAHEYNASKHHDLSALRALGWWPFTLDPATNAQEVVEWQAANGLTPDGKLGPASWAKLRELHAPAPCLRRLPHGLAEIVATFGNVDARGPTLIRCKTRPVSMHPLAAADFDVLFPVACRISGYTPVSVQTYNRRKKRGGLPSGTKPAGWSTHAWGIAFDADPSLNPWGNKPSAPVVAHPLFAAVFRVAGWSCGTDWKTPDTMHFQAATGY